MFLKKESIKILSIFNEKGANSSCGSDLCMTQNIESGSFGGDIKIEIQYFNKLLSYGYIVKRDQKTSYNLYSLSSKGEEIFYAYQKGKIIGFLATIQESYGVFVISILSVIISIFGLIISIIALCK